MITHCISHRALIFKSSDIVEAHIVSNMLKANDIEAFVGGHYIQGGVGEITGLNYASVFVPLKDIEESKKLILVYGNKVITTNKTEAPHSQGSSIIKKIFIALCCFSLIVFIGYLVNYSN